MVLVTWDKIGMKNLPKCSFFSTSTKTVPINSPYKTVPINYEDYMTMTHSKHGVVM